MLELLLVGLLLLVILLYFLFKVEYVLTVALGLSLKSFQLGDKLVPSSFSLILTHDLHILILFLDQKGISLQFIIFLPDISFILINSTLSLHPIILILPSNPFVFFYDLLPLFLQCIQHGLVLILTVILIGNSRLLFFHQ